MTHPRTQRPSTDLELTSFANLLPLVSAKDCHIRLFTIGELPVLDKRRGRLCNHCVYMCTTLNWEGLARHRLVLLKTYGSDTAKKWKQVILDMFSVTCGIKRAWLVDYFQPDAAKLQSVLGDVLSHEPSLNGKNICTVSINDDLLVVNIEDTLSACEELVQTASAVADKAGTEWTGQHSLSVHAGVYEFVVLGCSSNQHRATVDELAHILTELLPVVTALKEKLSAVKCVSPPPNMVGPDTMYLPHVAVTVPNGVNLCTLFGWLLGYPFVYWFPYSNGGSEVDLNMVPLTCYKVCYVSSDAVMSSSSTFDGMKMEGESVDSHPLVLYSFSVPTSVLTFNPLISEVVHEWFKRIKDSTLKLLGVTIQLRTTCVTLPHVVL